MKVLQEILAWSADRPPWQRDALRRLVVNGELSDDDIAELTEICKGDHGLAEKADTAPLAKKHVPDHAAASAAAVSLQSIFHHKGVNALADDQTLKFAPGLTIVYGDNGAGKTGYIRILKQACRARGREQLLGNVVVSDAAPPKPTVNIKYKVGDEPNAREWSGGDADEFISRVSIFDTKCAAVYLNERTDVAFLPFGLDLFDKLVRACRAVSARLEGERRALNTNALAAIIPTIPQGTAAAKLAGSITSLTKLETVTALTRLSSEETTRLELLEKSLLDLQANDPAKLIAQLNLRLNRVRTLAEHLRRLEEALSDAEIAAVFNTRRDSRRKGEEARRLRDAAFPQGMLPGTGGDQWKAMWEASRLFSEQHAYPGKPFPVTDDEAICVLCQQDLEDAAARRLRQFQDFVTSTTEKELAQLRQDFGQRRDAFSSLQTTTAAIEETLTELRLEHEAAAEMIGAAIEQNTARRAAVVTALAEDKDLQDGPALASASQQALAIATEIDARVKSLRESTVGDARAKIAAETQELRARALLGKHEETILDEIERKKRFAAYGQCIDETKPGAITQKSSAVTKAIVSESLKKSFRQELQNLEFKHVEVELKEQGGAEGVFYHKLILTRNPGIEVPKVVSEGEQRCISIAAFFAELSTADDPSAIVFDDPVSSLDFQWRHAVARRLVAESRVRQVIVFTHDVVFLLALKQFAAEVDITPLDQHVRRQSKGAGVCVEELPWVAMRVKDKIRYLKKQAQSADKLHRNGEIDAYEVQAKHLYGLLREAWERALEEVLLNGLVERYRPSVQTQRLAKITDISDADCKAVDTAMTKCSTWLTGHDQAAAARAPVPGSDELKNDIEALDTWVKAINKRRQ